MSRGDIVGAVLDHPAEYMIRHSRVRMMERAYEKPWFEEHYVKVARFALPGGREALRIYRRRADSSVESNRVAAPSSLEPPSASGSGD